MVTKMEVKEGKIDRNDDNQKKVDEDKKRPTPFPYEVNNGGCHHNIRGWDEGFFEMFFDAMPPVFPGIPKEKTDDGDEKTKDAENNKSDACHNAPLISFLWEAVEIPDRQKPSKDGEAGNDGPFAVKEEFERHNMGFHFYRDSR